MLQNSKSKFKTKFIEQRVNLSLTQPFIYPNYNYCFQNMSVKETFIVANVRWRNFYKYDYDRKLKRIYAKQGYNCKYEHVACEHWGTAWNAYQDILADDKWAEEQERKRELAKEKAEIRKENPAHERYLSRLRLQEKKELERFNAYQKSQANLNKTYQNARAPIRQTTTPQARALTTDLFLANQNYR